MILFKEGVRLKKNGIRVSAETWHAVYTSEVVFNKNRVDNLTITSFLDGVHGTRSKHYEGDAVDIRLPFKGLNFINEDYLNNQIVKEIKAILDEHYDIVLEKDHIHIEFDPKYN